MSFRLSANDKIAIVFSESESDAVKIACENLKRDLKETLNIEASEASKTSIYVATDAESGDNPETYSLLVKGECLYITGSDRRGTIYGIYTLSRMLGVSPWYFWADVPIKKRDSFELPDGFIKTDYPTVPYRGIFINDEEELDKWARLHMDEATIGVHTYEKIFELILRLRGNYIWPAMHVNSFNMSVENGALADRMGLVVGTSHCDMLMRSNNREWNPWLAAKGYEAEYDYSIEGKNREILKEYWEESVKQNKDFECCYTLGMRGIHDSGFVTKNLKADTDDELKDKKVKLLEQVINDQADILNRTLGRRTLKTFVPYKEVLNLYDRGLKVPDDITLVWTNDNYGYVRRYPSPAEQARSGGNGIYYHNSYWAGTLRHYLFVSSIPIAMTKYEMEKAYENGIRKLWVLNIGALKPLEQEMEFFLTLAWDIGKEDRITSDAEKYLAYWIDSNFSNGIGEKTAKLLNRYARVSNTRKVEFFEEDVFSQESYHNEAAIRLNTLKEVYDEANEIGLSLPISEQTAFFELVLMKIHASYYTAAMYYFADRSRICTMSGRESSSREYTELSKGFEDLRRKLLEYYNRYMVNGKWNGILTPEDFPPPRTAMHPASVPTLKITRWDRKDALVKSPNVAIGIDAAEGKLTHAKVIEGLGRGSVDLVECNPCSEAEYEFVIPSRNNARIVLFRYPSLNSTGEISVKVSVDGGDDCKIVCEANDENRGNWAQNVMDQTDRVTLYDGLLSKGKHVVKLSGSTRYFAFSKIVIYVGERLYDNLGAIVPGKGDYAGETLPDRSYYDEALDIWYGKIETPEWVIPKGIFANDINVCDPSDIREYSERERKIFMPHKMLSYDNLMDLGREIVSEKDGVIAIEAFSAFNETKNAYTGNGPWEYSTGVSYNRTNLAMYFRGRGRTWTDETEAPYLSYRFWADGGEYTLYALMRFSVNGTTRVHVEVDGKAVTSAWKGEKPWRYEGEQAFRYVPLVKLNLLKGEHELKVTIYASNLRLERFVLINGNI